MSPKAILIIVTCSLLVAATVATVGVTPKPQENEIRRHPTMALAGKDAAAHSADLLGSGNDEPHAIDHRSADKNTDAASRGPKDAAEPLAPRTSAPASHARTGAASALETASDAALPTKVSDRGVHAHHQRNSSMIAGDTRGTAAPSPRAPAPVRIGTPGVPGAEATDPPTTPRMPAVLAGPDPEKPLPQEVEKAIDQMAEDFAEKMEESGLTPEDPEYARLWQQAVEVSDHEFRARYGKQAWMRQHIEAHRMQVEAAEED